MWIESADNKLVNCDGLIEIFILGIDNSYSVAGQEMVKLPGVVKLGHYSDAQICWKAIEKIKYALKKDTKVFTMPTEEELKKDENTHIEVAKPCMTMEEAINLWNTLADKGFKVVSRMPTDGSQRCQLLKARLIQYTKEEWEKCIDNIRNSDLLQKNQDKWFNFDWFIKPSNFPKVLDGNYSNPKKDDSTVEKWW